MGVHCSDFFLVIHDFGDLNFWGEVRGEFWCDFVGGIPVGFPVFGDF